MEIQKSGKRAVLLGATGLVGSHLLQLLLSHQAYEKVKVIARKPNPGYNSEKLEWLVDSMKDWDTVSSMISGDDLYITIGTTIKNAGSREAFREIDHDLVFYIAKSGAVNGMRQLLLVSSVGADKDSIFFYNRVKGEIEEAVSALPFWAVHIFRPSVLLGEREEIRPLESIAQSLFSGVDKVIGGSMGKYRPVSGGKVAKSMVYFAQLLEGGRHIHASDEIYNFTVSELLKD